jgi:lipopolysaccharide transport system ATP-binding protein
MTDHCYVSINNATLAYPSISYNALTLKEEVFKILKLRKPTKLLCDVIALSDIYLKITEGEKIGIIGRNGSGKSSLLKAIAGLYPLQTGEIKTEGRIRSMFELNLGFEPDATGRENITYRCLLLGESPKSIKRIEEEIIDFSELGDFIDYPIKTYSSGMMIRLAFAISTTISGDIFLLDEILGAGDAPFQIKARNRLHNLISQAKIIVVVSHDMASIRNICNRAIYLRNGQIVQDGNVESVILEYMNAIEYG